MNDLFNVLKRSFRLTNSTLKKQPIALGIPVLLALVFGLTNTLMLRVAGTSMALGFVLALAYSMIISMGMRLYYYLIQFDRIDKDFHQNWRPYFLPVYTMYFILMLVKIFAYSFTGIVPLMVVLYIFINPIPEVIYYKAYSGLEGIRYGLEFQRENFIYWMIPLFIYLIANYLLLGIGQVLNGIIATDLINQMTGLTNDISLKDSGKLARDICSLLVTGYYMVYRGHLFKILSGSSKRKRIYMGEYYG